MKAQVFILAILMGLSTVVMAQPGEKTESKNSHGVEWKGRMHAGQGQNGPMQALNLSDAQKEAFKQSMMAMQKELKPLRNELGEAMAHQRTLVSADTPDMKAIDKNLEKIGDLKTEMAKIRTKHHLEMRAQLTDEQKLKFDLFKDRMKDQKGDMFGKHFMGMPHGAGLN